MAQTITISIPIEDFEFLKERQKMGLSPSRLFQDALARVRRQVNEGIDLSEVAIASKFERYNQLIQKLNRFLDKRGLQNVFLEEERAARDTVDGIPQTKTGSGQDRQRSEEDKDRLNFCRK